MVWVDRLGFDIQIYSPDNDVFEVRIPFPREVTNEKGAKSSFNGMSQGELAVLKALMKRKRWQEIWCPVTDLDGVSFILGRKNYEAVADERI
ncbi:proton gradient regulation 7 [Artemisia annua]|uniref:Proton gradient regulation 7 n=1 Tax=Artemisia annua TaxID=35608 RepID=A0A2U1QNS0_ARTAN|nr:proton gradient regulation 7 [Artemisia annua]